MKFPRTHILALNDQYYMAFHESFWIREQFSDWIYQKKKTV